MVMECLEIGPTPCDEECVQVGAENYQELMTAECQRFIQVIRKKLGNEPPGAKLFVKWNQHDFGMYAEVACKFDPENEAAMDYAFRCESEAPAKWEE